LKSSDPAGILPGYDYDVATEEVILDRVDVQDGRIVLPDGMSYHLLALADYDGFSLPVLKKLKNLLEKGAVIVGSKPKYRNSLASSESADREFIKISDELWGENFSTQTVTDRKIGKGRLISGMEVRKVLENHGVNQDFSFSTNNEDAKIDYIHRADPSADVFFISNQTDKFENINARFRITGKQPEFWDAVTGNRWPAKVWTEDNGHTAIPIELTPYGSLFVVFRGKAVPPEITKNNKNFLKFDVLQIIKGDWEVDFDEDWGGPGSIIFPELLSWTDKANPGIKYYSGTATYRKKIDLQFDISKNPKKRYFIDLGKVKELAEIRLNGKKLGIVWSPPFRVEITDALLPITNELEIDVVNFWPNRVIGDQSLPEDQKYTKTNLNISKDTPLMISGLLGPVRLLEIVE
jgi:hypothetical protein